MSQEQAQTATFDGDNLYQEETFTDQKVGSLRRMTPVTRSGEPDSSRPVLYIGQTQVMTQMGALPLTFELDVDNLADAIDAFTAGAKQAFEDTMKQVEEMRREQASSIVVPGSAGGGVPGGSKFQL